MKRATVFSRVLGAGRDPRVFVAGVVAVLALTATLGAFVISAVSAHDKSEGNIFRPFRDDSGFIQSATPDPALNAANKFFDPRLGTNGQACVTCHQPDQGITIHVDVIQDSFEETEGLDPLFRANDTADRPDADVSTFEARRIAFKLFRELGIVRIGKTLPARANFIVAPQDTPQFGPLPNSNDPQAPPGSLTLSLFRRPLVNTNVNFDSAVLWDGRASITNLRNQVQRAARSLLLSGGPSGGALGDVSDADADDVAAFMTGVFTDQVFVEKGGKTDAHGATSAWRIWRPLLPTPPDRASSLIWEC